MSTRGGRRRNADELIACTSAVVDFSRTKPEPLRRFLGFADPLAFRPHENVLFSFSVYTCTFTSYRLGGKLLKYRNVLRCINLRRKKETRNYNKKQKKTLSSKRFLNPLHNVHPERKHYYYCYYYSSSSSSPARRIVIIFLSAVERKYARARAF